MIGYFTAGLWPNDLTEDQNDTAWWTTGIPPDDIPAGGGGKLIDGFLIDNYLINGSLVS
jgi:hypothetical protein